MKVIRRAVRNLSNLVPSSLGPVTFFLEEDNRAWSLIVQDKPESPDPAPGLGLSGYVANSPRPNFSKVARVGFPLFWSHPIAA